MTEKEAFNDPKLKVILSLNMYYYIYKNRFGTWEHGIAVTRKSAMEKCGEYDEYYIIPNKNCKILVINYETKFFMLFSKLTLAAKVLGLSYYEMSRLSFPFKFKEFDFYKIPVQKGQNKK
jgi:hypothetical protein